MLKILCQFPRYHNDLEEKLEFAYASKELKNCANLANHKPPYLPLKNKIGFCLTTVRKINSRIESLEKQVKKTRSKKLKKEIEEKVKTKQKNKYRLLSELNIKYDVLNKIVMSITNPEKEKNTIPLNGKYIQQIEELKRLNALYEQEGEKIIKSHLKLSFSIAKKLQNRGLSLDDLIQEGSIGLIYGLDKFNYELGNKFSTFVTWRIKQNILRKIKEQKHTIRMPSHINERLLQFNNTISKIRFQLDRKPTVEEIAKKLNTDTEYVEESIKIKKLFEKRLSLDSSINEDSEFTFTDILKSPNSDHSERYINQESLKKQLDKAMQSLPNQERTIIKFRFGLDGEEKMTLREIGDKLNLTKERIRQIERKAIRKLGLPSKLELFAEFEDCLPRK